MENDRRRGVSYGEEMCFNRIISRNSSVGYSSRIYYCRSSGQGIPFDWEMQPGTPKEPQKEDDILPPISPPPALLSLGLPKPCFNIVDEPKPKPLIMKLKMFKFWKRAGKRSNKKVDRGDQSDEYSNYETSSSDDGDFIVSSSPPRVSSSLSSSSFSLSNGASFRSTCLSRESSLNRRYGCSPEFFLLACSCFKVKVMSKAAFIVL